MSINASDLTERNIVIHAPLFTDNELGTLRDTLRARLPPGTASPGTRYTASAADLLLSKPIEAALGVSAQLGLADSELRLRMAGGVQAIVDECEAQLGRGTARSREDMRLLEYVLHEPAAAHEGLHEEGRAGQSLAYFTAHPNARRAGLSAAHVVALRFYTTEAYTSINEPLRDVERGGPHPFAATVAFIAEAIGKLGALQAPEASSSSTARAPPARLWRGMRNVRAPEELMRIGGTELAPLSCTPDLALAARFAAAKTSLLFVMSDSSFMQRGASLQWLSTMPHEDEYLYPPCTYVQPTGRKQSIQVTDQVECIVLEVTPQFRS